MTVASHVRYSRFGREGDSRIPDDKVLLVLMLGAHGLPISEVARLSQLTRTTVADHIASAEARPEETRRFLTDMSVKKKLARYRVRELCRLLEERRAANQGAVFRRPIVSYRAG